MCGVRPLPALCLLLLSIIYIFIFLSTQPREEQESTTVKHAEVISYDHFSQCRLTLPDPFSGGIEKTIIRKNPLLNCDTHYKPATRLVNSFIFVDNDWIENIEVCRVQCQFYKSVLETEPGAWQQLFVGDTLKMECDFVLAECYRGSQLMDVYLHSQIYETNFRTVDVVNEPSPQTIRPDIHVILVDSVSATQALRYFWGRQSKDARRSLPKTLAFLRDEMDGVFMHHLNKVADNSRPNGFALLMGKRIFTADRNFLGLPNLKPQLKFKQYCRQPKDDEAVIFKEYEKKGYKTMYSEDYIDGDMWTWPSCVGFSRQPSNHNFRFGSAEMRSASRPLPITVNATRKLGAERLREKCIEMHRLALKYHAQFASAYPETPKFGMSWIAHLAHNDPNLLFHADADFENFFRENQKALANSFIFFMADHGIRFGATLNTELGHRELKNPFLVVVIPEYLRRNPTVMANLQLNSRKLITHFDVHATLYDILTFDDFSAKEVFTPNPNNASSLLRPVDELDNRNCRNIPIQPDYCLCEYEKVAITNEALKQRLASSAIYHLNEQTKEVRDKCRFAQLLKATKVEAFVPEDEYKLYELVFTTRQRGVFQARLRMVNGEPELAGTITRLNAYGNAADCIASSHPTLRPFCACQP